MNAVSLLEAPVRSWRAELIALARLAAPIAIAQVGWATMGFVDVAVVGRLGAESLAAVGLANGLFLTVTVMGLGLMMGIDPLIAQAFGARDPIRARRALWQGVYLALGAAAVLTGPALLASALLEPAGVAPGLARETGRVLALRVPGLLPLLLFFAVRSYLQAAERTRMLVVSTVVANILNLGLDVLLVFGGRGWPAWTGLQGVQAMGAAGSGLATTLCIAAQLVVVVFAVRRFPLAQPPADVWRPLRGELRTALRVGVPVALHLAAETGVFSLAGLLAGRLGAASAAAHQVALVYASLSFCVALGVGNAGAVRVGWAVGAGDTRAARRSGLTALAGGTAFMGCAAIAFWLFRLPLANLITDKSDVIAIAVPLLAITAVFQVSDGLQGIGAGVLRGAGDSRFTFIANIVGHYCVGLPIALWLLSTRGVIGIWWGLCCGLTAVALALVVRFLRLSSRPIVSVLGPEEL